MGPSTLTTPRLPHMMFLGLAEEPGEVEKSGPWFWKRGITIVKKIACPLGVKTDFSLVIALLLHSPCLSEESSD